MVYLRNICINTLHKWDDDNDNDDDDNDDDDDNNNNNNNNNNNLFKCYIEGDIFYMHMLQILDSVCNKSCQSYFKILHELFCERT